MQFSAGELASPLVGKAVRAFGRPAAAGWDRHMAVHLLDTSRALAELAVVDTPSHRMDMAGIALAPAAAQLADKIGRVELAAMALPLQADRVGMAGRAVPVDRADQVDMTDQAGKLVGIADSRAETPIGACSP